MRIGPQRPVNPDAIVVPNGYRVEALVTGLTFPSAISFGPGGELYLAESGGVAGRVVAVPRVLRIDPDRSVNEIGRLDNPIVGLVYRAGELLIGEDGPSPRVLRVTAEGEVKVLVEGLPGGGDYGLSSLSLDAAGALLFGLGTRTNSGVVGLDNAARDWVARNPEWADVPGTEVKLAGVNYVTTQSTAGGSARQSTGGFKPFGRRSTPNESVSGSNRCSGGVFRLPQDGTEPERLAWGFRNPLGIAVTGDGRILATEGGMEERGSRPIAGASDNLWEVRAGQWYGWPDFASGVSVSDARFRLPGHPLARRLAPNLPDPAVAPLATFASRSGVGRLDVSHSENFGLVGQALVALSGEWTLSTYPGDEGPGGHRVVAVDLATGQATDFLINRQRGPASAGNSGGLERPFDVRFDPTGEVLYVVDMGEVNLSREMGLEPYGGTGVLWRITRSRTQVTVDRAVERSGARSGRGDRAAAPVAEELEPTDGEELIDDLEAEKFEGEDQQDLAFDATETQDETDISNEPESSVDDAEPDAPISDPGDAEVDESPVDQTDPSNHVDVSIGAGPDAGSLSLEPLGSEEPAESGDTLSVTEADAPEVETPEDAGNSADDISEGAPSAHPVDSPVGDDAEPAAEPDAGAVEPADAAGDVGTSDGGTSESPEPAATGPYGGSDELYGSPEQSGGE